MNLRISILMICFVTQVLNTMAVPVDPIRLAQLERNSNSNQFNSVTENKGMKARVKKTEFARKLTTNVGSHDVASQELKSRTNNVYFGKRNPAKASLKKRTKGAPEVDERLDTGLHPVAVEAGGRLLIPLPNFPPSGTESIVTGTPVPTTSVGSPPSLPAQTIIDLTADPSPEAHPQGFPRLESDGYSNISLDIEGEYEPLPSPPAQVSQLFDFIDLSLSPTAEPTMEASEAQPYTYLPLEYDEFKDSGYNPWTAIFVYVRRLLLGN